MGQQLRSRAQRWAGATAAAVAATAALSTVVVSTTATTASAAPSKVTICHRTHSTTNPYRRITVSQSAITRAHGHGDHEHDDSIVPPVPAVFDSAFAYAPNGKSWGDVIPSTLNWTVAGQAIFDGAACGGMSAKEFYDVEIEAGVPEADVLADLNQQMANEDKALLAALGGSFTAGNLSQWETAVSVTTVAASSVTASGATLNGVLTVGTTSTVTGFEYGTSSTLSTSSAVAATPSPITGSDQAVTAVVGSLSPSTTYWFRATGTTKVGTDEEATLRGEILSFTTPAAVEEEEEEPGGEEPGGEEPTDEEPTDEEPTDEEPTDEEPTDEEPTDEEPTDEEPTDEEPSDDDDDEDEPERTDAAPGTDTTPPRGDEEHGGEGALGRIEGIVWFDRNHDGSFGPGEWVLPGVTVELRHGAELGAAAAALKATPKGTVVATAVTGPNGEYSFEDLGAGEYQVGASASIEGFDHTSDTDGELDWLVGVDVVVDTTGVADFAGLGKGEIVGQMFDTQTLAGLANAAVTCTWGGYDDVLGNADDLPFTVTAAADGTFDMKGVPYGVFTCEGVDEAGRRSAKAAAAVWAPEPVEAPLPVGDAKRTAPAGQLPHTGSDLVLVYAGVGAIALGTSLDRIARRRQRRH